MAANDFVGNIAEAGDVNGDGFGDLIVAASGVSGGTNNAGEAYVIFGQATGFDPVIDPSAFDGNNGFKLTAAVPAKDHLFVVSGAGDVNGDGLGDVIIGAQFVDVGALTDAGAAYVVLGRSVAFPAAAPANSGSIGAFGIFGAAKNDRLGTSVSGAGDVNGDGFDDLLIGTSTFNSIYGGSYVVFGNSATFGATFELSKLNGASGFEINGGPLQFGAGRAVAAAGDVNGDGFDDVVLGAEGATLRGRYSGGAFVVYGKAAGFTPTFNVGNLNAPSGFILSGEAAFNSAGFAVGGGGDFNGDGFDDVLVGAVFNRANGQYSRAGHVFLGFDSGAVTHPGDANANTLAGDGNANVLIGARGSDTLLPNGGADVARGAQGDDIFGLGSLDFFRINGGLGADTLRFDGAGLALDLSTTASTALSGIERIDLAGAGANTLTLTPLEVLNLSPTSNTLTLLGGADDFVNLGPNWFRGVPENIGGTDFTVLHHGEATLKIAVGVGTSPIAGWSLPHQNGERAFTINGTQPFGTFGQYAASAGDVNGDGFEDVIIGDNSAMVGGVNRGAAYVVFGAAGGFTPTLEASALNGTNGFRITKLSAASGDAFGFRVNGAIGVAPAGSTSDGAAYIVYGKKTPFAAKVPLANFTAADGFSVTGESASDLAGASVTTAGDVNGDGFDDVLIVAPAADFSGPRTGGAYLLLGQAGGFGNLSLAQIDGQNLGFKLDGSRSFFEAISAADINGDGFDDIIYGERGGSVGGFAYDPGVVHVFFGLDTGAVTHAGDANANTLTGDASANVFVAGQANDMLLGNGGADAARGGQGDDLFAITDLNFRRLHGGTGLDTLRLDGAGFTLDLTTLADSKLEGFEQIDITGTGPNTLTLSVRDVANLSPTSNTLTVIGDAGGAVNFGPGWIREPDEMIGGDPFRVFTSVNGAVTLQISAAITHPLPSGYVPEFFDGAAGATIDGVGSRNEVAPAGDMNGDGYDDFLIGAFRAPSNGAGSGAVYVVFGSAAGLPSPVVISTLNGTDGFVIRGEAAGDQLGLAPTGASGDFNGDGFSDVLLPARNASGANQSGSAYVVYGKGTPFAPALELSALNGTDGYKLRATAFATDRYLSASSAGDVNADGYDDFALGAPNVVGAGEAGAAYVVFGRATSPAPVLDLATLNGANGFTISGAKRERIGVSVSGADVNGDGFSDAIIDASGSFLDPASSFGKVDIVFGKAGGFAASLATAGLNGSNGFTLRGASQQSITGGSVSGAGDVNGDGAADLIVGAAGGPVYPSGPGVAFVVFGKNGGAGFGASVNLSALNGSNGFRIDGAAPAGQAGASVSAAGDVNGDGFDDLLAGSPYAFRRFSDRGEAYVIFGQGTPFAATFNAAALDGTNGFAVVGEVGSEVLGRSVAGVGDVNGDGFDDLLAGTYGPAAGLGVTGKSYFIYGFDTGKVTLPGDAMPNTLTGTGSGDSLVAGQDDDMLLALNSGDSACGGGGDDLFAIDLQSFRRIAGGTGLDTLQFTGTDLGLNLPALPDKRLTGIERIDLRGAGANTLIFNLREVANLSATSNTLVVQTDASDFVNIGAGWISQGNEIIGGDSFLVFKQAATTLKIQEGSIAITLVDAKTATFTDVDGDLVTVKVSKGTLSFADCALAPAGTVGGFQLQKINFADDGAEFQDADITLSAKPTVLGGDGHVNVGAIFATGIDLGKVSIPGDLRAIMAGDPTLTTPGLDSLAIASMGRFGNSTQGAAPLGFSIITGTLGALDIDSDLVDAPISAFGPAGGMSFGKVTIGGSIVGGTSTLTGLFADRSIGAIKIGQDLRTGSAMGAGIIQVGGNVASLAVGAPSSDSLHRSTRSKSGARLARRRSAAMSKAHGSPPPSP